MTFTHTTTCACGAEHEIVATVTADSGSPPTRDYPGDPPSIEVIITTEPFHCACGVYIDTESDALRDELGEAAQRELAEADAYRKGEDY